MFHSLVTLAQPVLDDLLAEIRRSPTIHADETGWREDGVNSSIWSVCPPPGRSSEDHHARAGDVVTPCIGEHIPDVLGSDMSAGYTTLRGSITAGGRSPCVLFTHTRTHFLRMRRWCAGPPPSTICLIRRWRGLHNTPIPASHLASSPRGTSRSSRSSNSTYGLSATQTCGRPHSSRSCANAWQTLYPTCVCVAVPGVPAHTTVAEPPGDRTHDPWRLPLPQGQRSPSGTGQPLRSLDGSGTLSFPSVSCSPDHHTLLRRSLNSYATPSVYRNLLRAQPFSYNRHQAVRERQCTAPKGPGSRLAAES